LPEAVRGIYVRVETDKLSNANAGKTKTFERDEMSGFVIGVDIGGTKVAAGLVDLTTGQIRSQNRVPMVANGDAAAGMEAVTRAIDELLTSLDHDSKTILGIGVCAPGPLDPNTGVVVNPPNVPCWRNFPLADEISERYGKVVKLDNDANAAALAETLWGAGCGYRNIFYTTIGTGIGTGIILDGRIYHGRTGAAGEGGHMSIDYNGIPCGCGKRGCIETLASGPAISKAARARLRGVTGPSRILEMAGGDVSAVTSEMVGDAYLESDQTARAVLNQTVEYLCFWLGNVVDLLEPEVIIMGGGVSSMLRPFLGELGKRLPSKCVNQRANEILILPSFYGSDAGIAGAAAICSHVLVRE
jgi:glucokinase